MKHFIETRTRTQWLIFSGWVALVVLLSFVNPIAAVVQIPIFAASAWLGYRS